MHAPSSRPIQVVAGNGNPDLAAAVAEKLGVALAPLKVNERACGEVAIRIPPCLRGADVYIVQTTCGTPERDVNTTLMELLLMIRRIKLEQPARVSAIVPFFAYARQDRKTDLRCPISASAVSLLIDKMGVDRVATIDLHSGQIQGYFNDRAPLDNLSMAREFANHVNTKCKSWYVREKTVIVSPDAGGVARAHAFADLLRVEGVVTIMKRRAGAGMIESMQTVGEVAGLSCIVLDDMVDTGGTLVKACELLKERGAARVVACITHGILTEPGCARIEKCAALQEVITTDTLPQAAHVMKCSKLTVLSCAPLLAQAISTYHNEQSVSALFDRAPSTTPPPSTPTPDVSPRAMSRNPSSPSVNSMAESPSAST